jgi:hypothetical protein
METQERACEIEENLIFSHHHNANCPQDIVQENQMIHLVQPTPPTKAPCVTKTYLQMEENKVDVEVVNHMFESIKR